MKRTILFLALLASASIAGFAQTHKHHHRTKAAQEPKVVTAPANVQNSFNQQYAGVTQVKWNPSYSGNWDALFAQDSTQVDAQFDSTGKWIATHTVYSGENVPAPIANDIRSKFPNASIKDATKVERQDIASFYRVDIDDQGISKTLLANDQGTVTE